MNSGERMDTQESLRQFDRPGVTTLAATVGAIVGCFIIMVVLQHLIKRYLCCCCKKQGDNSNSGRNPLNTSQENPALVSDLTQIVIPKVTSSSPPSYGEIHLYKQLDATCCSPDYNTVSGMSNYYGVALTSEEIEKDIEESPPSYEENVENVQERADMFSISARVQEQESPGHSETIQSVDV